MLQNFKKSRHIVFECKLVGKCKSALEISEIEMVQAEDEKRHCMKSKERNMMGVLTLLVD